MSAEWALFDAVQSGSTTRSLPDSLRKGMNHTMDSFIRFFQFNRFQTNCYEFIHTNLIISIWPTLPTVASTATFVVVVFAPAPLRAMAVRRVALSFSFSIAVARIFSLLAASPSHPRRFASTVAAPPFSLSKRPSLFLVRKVYCCARRTGLDVADVVISSQIFVVLIASPPSPPTMAGM